MSPRLSKKAVIREYLERERPARIGVQEAAAIRRELARVLGPRARISRDYLLDVLAELGAEAAPEIGGVPRAVLDLLHFDTLDSAEAALRALDTHYRDVLAHQDRAAIEDLRRGALWMRQRCEIIARNRRVAEAKRAEKQEIAQWCGVWLQTPDVFLDWLELRKKRLESDRAG